MAATTPRLYRRLKDFVPDGIPFSGLLISALETFDVLWIGELSFESSDKSGSAAILVQVETELKIPGVDVVSLVFSPGVGGLEFTIEAGLEPAFHFAIRKVSLELRIKNDLLRVVKDNSREVDPDRPYLAIKLDQIDLSVDSEGRVALELPQGLSLPRCMIGSTGIIISASGLNWLTPQSTRPDMPPGFSGLYVGEATLDIPNIELPQNEPEVVLKNVYIGTGGLSGRADFSLPAMWLPDEKTFDGPAAVDLFGFAGCLTHVGLALQQSALTECVVEGAIYAPYIERVIGLSIGFDGDGALTAIAQPPSATITGLTRAAGTPNDGYILSADIADVFKFDVSRVAVQAGGGRPALLALSGRVKLDLDGFELPAVEFKGLSIDSEGHVAVEGGWLDVDQAKSGPLSGFPLQITRIGFGVEKDGRAWIGLNGGIKLHDILPVGASVEGLKVSWKENEDVHFSLEGIGVELAVEGTFSFSGKAAFFKTDIASGFRATIKLSLDSVGLAIDVGMMVGRMTDGTFFFYLYIGVDLPVGIPLFSTGAAIYGFAGLLAVNLLPARVNDEHWYYGYYKRPPAGVTPPEKWAVKRDAFAIGVGVTIGTMPDTAYAVSAKVLLILSLPGPRILLQGKGNFIEKKPDNKGQGKEGTFEALLVLDTPAKLFQANLAITFKMGALLEIGGGLDAAFSWADQPPADVWHVYAGEKEPPERRVRAKLLDLLKGDTWLMINRPHYIESADALAKRRIGDFEIGGSVSLGVDYDFSVAKAWIKLSIFGQAAITWEPQQFFAEVELLGSAGIMALGMEIVAELRAGATAKASKPWYFGASIEVEVRINLIFFKWELHERLFIEYTKPELPDYVRDFVAISADHVKASEARELPSVVVPPAAIPIVPPDTRPVVVFSKPVRDLAWFAGPGDPNLPAEDLDVRQVSYQLRHVVLVTSTGGNARLVGAAGEATVTGTSVALAGLDAAENRLPDLTGASMTLFQAGDSSGRTFPVIASSGNGATLSGTPPQGALCYRLTAPQPQASVSITSTADAGFGQVQAALGTVLATPERYRGGSLTSGSATWRVMDATASSVRLQIVDDTAPGPGPAMLKGPTPSVLEGMWAPTGEPVDEPGSSTRLQIWARTPFAMFRYNQEETIQGLDAFRPDYACGPTPFEEAVCSKFEDVAAGPLPAAFVTAGISVSTSGPVSAIPGTAGTHTLGLGNASIVFLFDPPADAAWVSAAQGEYGVIRAFRDGSRISETILDRAPKRYRFAGGVDRIEIEGVQVTIYEICYMPGWTCVAFEASSFPQNTTGEITYAGVRMGTTASMSVTDGVLHVAPRSTLDPPRRLRRSLTGTQAVRRMATSVGGDAVASIPVSGLEEAFVSAHPILGDVQFVPGLTYGSDPPARPLLRSRTQPWERIERRLIDRQIVWRGGTSAPLITLAIEFERPVTRARVALGACHATVVAFAGTMTAATGAGTPGETVSLFANPAGPAYIGWFNRLVITADREIQISEICTDRGDFGWERYEQWTWRQGVRRSVEWLYDEEPILPPGDYELRVHTAAVVTGEQPTSETFATRGQFTVGNPPGFPQPVPAPEPPDADPRAWNYPHGGPLTTLATYVDRTMPAPGARLWYRGLDTAVAFNENYVTRMYVEANHELQVAVLNASSVALRNATRHVWARGAAELEATTSLYVRTLVGDGTDRCASVDLAKIVGPERVTAGAGELLDPMALHVSELRSRRNQATLHRFEFTTSRFALFSHLCATFDGLCWRRTPVVQSAVWNPRDNAQARLDQLATLDDQRQQAKSAIAALQTGSPSSEQILSAKGAPAKLAKKRREVAAGGATAFDDIWSKCFGGRPQPPAPDGLRLSAIRAGNPTASDLLLVESPEPIAWDRVSASIQPAVNIPLRRTEVVIAGDFGRPDQGFEIEYGGLRWRAGVELWFADGAVRARADVPLDVTILLPRSTSADIVVRAGAAGRAQVTCEPAAAQATETPGAQTGQYNLGVRAPAGAFLTSVRVQGAGVGIVSCAVTTPFRPSVQPGDLCIVDVKLPATPNAIDHEIALLAMAPVSLKGWTVRWIDAVTPSGTQLYAECSADVRLGEARRVRLIPDVASAPPSDDDALVVPGGAGSPPPTAGAVFQVFDPLRRLVDERAAMAVVPVVTPLAVIPSADGVRAFLIPASTANGLVPGCWTLTLTLAGDIDAPDLDRWTVAGRVVSDVVRLPFSIETT